MQPRQVVYAGSDTQKSNHQTDMNEWSGHSVVAGNQYRVVRQLMEYFFIIVFLDVPTSMLLGWAEWHVQFSPPAQWNLQGNSYHQCL